MNPFACALKHALAHCLNNACDAHVQEAFHQKSCATLGTMSPDLFGPAVLRHMLLTPLPNMLDV